MWQLPENLDLILAFFRVWRPLFGLFGRAANSGSEGREAWLPRNVTKSIQIILSLTWNSWSPGDPCGYKRRIHSAGSRRTQSRARSGRRRRGRVALGPSCPVAPLVPLVLGGCPEKQPIFRVKQKKHRTPPKNGLPQLGFLFVLLVPCDATGRPGQGELHAWDVSYYSDLLKREELSLDDEKLKDPSASLLGEGEEMVARPGSRANAKATS